MILQSLAGLPAFVVYFCTAIVAVVAYLFVYTRVTPHDEFQLIRDIVPSAAIALGLSLLGFVLPVVSAIAPFRQCLGLPDLERDRAGGPDHRLFRRENPGTEPFGADRRGRSGARDLARAFLAGRRRAERCLHDLLTMAEKPRQQFGRRIPAAPPPALPAKRSGHVALLLMGTFAIGGGAYALMPRGNCQPAAAGMPAPSAAECRNVARHPAATADRHRAPVSTAALPQAIRRRARRRIPDRAE